MCARGLNAPSTAWYRRSMRFETVMRPFGNNTGIEVPPEVIEALGGGKRPAVAVEVPGYAYRSTVGVRAEKPVTPFSAASSRSS